MVIYATFSGDLKMHHCEVTAVLAEGKIPGPKRMHLRQTDRCRKQKFEGNLIISEIY